MINQSRRPDGKLTSLLVTRPGFRLCSKCQIEKPEGAFGPRKYDESGNVVQRDPRCRPCAAAYIRAYRAANPEIMRRHEQKRMALHGEKRREQRRIARLQNPKRFQDEDRRDYTRHRERHIESARAEYQKNRDLIHSRRRLTKELEWAKERFASGFLLVLIEHSGDWRTCPRERFRPRTQECVIAELLPHPDGFGWKVLPWPVIDRRNQHWLQKVTRSHARERRRAMLEAAVPAEVIAQEVLCA